MNNRNIIVLTRPPIMLVPKLTQKIGDPREYEQNLKNNNFSKNADISIPQVGQPAGARPAPPPLAGAGRYEESKVTRASGIIQNRMAADNDLYTPVKALNTFNPDWKIKVRITKKGDVKHWKNARGEGYLLNVDLIDAYGDQIQGTFFKEGVDKYKDDLHKDRVYLMSGGTVKMANQRFTSIRNDFCITFDQHAEIIEVPDDAAIKNMAYAFVTVRDI